LLRPLFWLVTLASILVTLLTFASPATATTELYTLSLHDALPIWAVVLLPAPEVPRKRTPRPPSARPQACTRTPRPRDSRARKTRSEEHTSELQSRVDLVCRLLLEKKKNTNPDSNIDERTQDVDGE